MIMQAPGFVGAAGDRPNPLEDIMSEPRLVDMTGRRRSPAAIPGHWAGCARRRTRDSAIRRIRQRSRRSSSLCRRPAQARMRTGRRALIAILWRAGLRISEALALTESDLDPKTGSVLVRVGKGGKRRTVGIDDWAWEHVCRWTEHRVQLPVGPLFCILAGPTRGRGWSATAARGEVGRLAARGWSEAAVRAAPVASCSRDRDGPRRDPVADHPKATRACPPRDHVDLPAGNRYP